MAEVQVILTGAKSWQDGKFKFKQNVPVTMDEQQARKYKTHSYFAVRNVQQAQRMRDLERATAGAGARKVEAAPITEADATISRRKPKIKTRDED